jgi:general stress protein CsbA
MEICALEIATQSVFTLKKMIAHVLAVILLVQSATAPTMMNALIVTMDLFV